MPRRRVIVTRPAREASRWVADLRGAGVDAIALPLIEIASLEDRHRVEEAWQRIASYDALMFVSAAAATHFFDGASIDAAAHCRFWATGAGTVRGLREAGVPASSIDAPAADAAQFDSEALWALVRSQVRPGMRVLIVRGGDATGQAVGREWLAREIAEAGATCDAVAAYRRLVPAIGEAERRVIAEAADGSAIWLFSSSEAIANLRALAPTVEWHAAGALATHERIAHAARTAGFGRVRVSSPSLSSLVASIESFA
ncbi:uroporphyrinogen-III synthase [Variovorax sp. YR216]|uniref:uroporphyrinogen-III synthase n=1 Tax=Variovorax sp. YR216 TaxID=1882828 RepID=UPI000898C339|nr:uroporphyrinogen-III synthase [Variovorax sp. YR216]SEA33809.1 uroporphyrinogen-III synthase [Variovorax sp. YR216]